MTELVIPKAPALPLAPTEFTPSYQNRYSGILRLYFNQLDVVNSSVLGPLGVAYLNAPYIAASDSTDQYADGDDDPTIVKWDSADAINGFVLNPNGTATVTVPGVYKIDYSIQFANSDNNDQHDAFVWLQENGTVIPNSSSKFTVPKAKNAATPAYIVGYSSIVFVATPADEIGLWWATDQAAVSGGTTGIYIEHLPAQTTPYIRPATPSAIGSITFLSRL